MDIHAQVHGPPVNEGINVERNPPPQPDEELLHEEPPIPVEGQQYDEEADRNAQAEYNLEQRSLKLPQPTVEGFSYLPSHCQMHPFDASENEAADGIAQTVEEFFTENVRNPRLRIDTELKQFKKLTKQVEDGPLPACFAVWKDMAVEDNFTLQRQQEKFVVELDENYIVKRIVVNAERDTLTPEVNAIGDQMKNLLTACHGFLAEQENVNSRLNEQVIEFQKIRMRTLKTDKTLRDLESLPTEVGMLCKQVSNLLQDIKAAVSSKYLTSPRVKQTTGLIMLLPDEP